MSVLLDALKNDLQARPGKLKVRTVEMQWDHGYIDFRERNDTDWRSLGDNSIASIQLSRSAPTTSRTFLLRRKKHARHLLNAELRTFSGTRIRLSAHVDDPTRLRGIPHLDNRGETVPLSTLCDLIATARSLDGPIALWSPSEEERSTSSLPEELIYLASLRQLWTRGNTYTVDPDAEDADFHDIARALDLAAPWSTLVISAHIFRLSHPLRIPIPIRLQGAGHVRTRIVSEAAEATLILTPGCTLFAASDIAIEHTGNLPAHVILSQGVPVDLNTCLITGGSASPDAPHSGSGVCLQGAVLGGLRGCDIVRNQGHGILLEDQTRLALEGNACQLNGQCGIAFRHDSSGFARWNSCHSNALHGIFLTEHAYPTLLDNTCQDNTTSGIHIECDALGLVENNTCERNGVHGIGVEDDAFPVLRNNSCTHNTQAGIAFIDRTRGLAENNTCSDNALYGLYIGNQATPRLTRNTCARNTHSGIVFRDQAQGLTQHNTTQHNTEHGFYIDDSASPELVDNTASHNQACGCFIRDNASPTLRNNTLHDNKHDGIHVSDHAAPRLTHNTCSGNHQDGISLRDTAAAHLAHNTCSGNHQDGIFISRLADGTTLEEDNVTEGNAGAPVRDERT